MKPMTLKEIKRVAKIKGLTYMSNDVFCVETQKQLVEHYLVRYCEDERYHSYVVLEAIHLGRFKYCATDILTNWNPTSKVKNER